jgi:hypothetical protein
VGHVTLSNGLWQGSGSPTEGVLGCTGLVGCFLLRSPGNLEKRLHSHACKLFIPPCAHFSSPAIPHLFRLHQFLDPQAHPKTHARSSRTCNTRTSVWPLVSKSGPCQNVESLSWGAHSVAMLIPAAHIAIPRISTSPRLPIAQADTSKVCGNFQIVIPLATTVLHCDRTVPRQ